MILPGLLSESVWQDYWQYNLCNCSPLHIPQSYIFKKLNGYMNFTCLYDYKYTYLIFKAAKFVKK